MKTRIVLLLVALGIAAIAASNDPAGEPSEMRASIERYTADRGSLERYYDIALSPVTQKRMRDFYDEWLAKLPAVDFDMLSQDGKIDYLLFRSHLQHQLRLLDSAAGKQAEAAQFLPFTRTVLDLEQSRRRMEPVDPRKAAGTLNNMTAQIAEVRRKVESAPPAKVVANRAAIETAELQRVLKHWFDYYNSYDPLFTWWVSETYKECDAALQSYTVFLREKIAGVRGAVSLDRPGSRGSASQTSAAPTGSGARMDSADDIIGDPIGRDGLMAELAHEMIPYTPEELIALANKEFAWCEDEMKRASRELGFGDEWKKALEQVKNMYVEPGKQPDLIRDLEREAEAFLDEHDLITIPPLARETWRMEMMSPERQLVNPFFTGGETISVSYPVGSMTFEQKMMSMRGNNIPFSRATVFHELIPGHELQGYMANRYHAYRRIFGTPFLTEGWSLYWELLLWDMQFQKTPADRIGALFWRMHRCARIIFSLSFHLGKMTPQECVDFLVDRVGHERNNAIGEVRRSFSGNDGPLYQAAYLLGGLQLYSLHKDLVGSGTMTNKQFHDAVLKEGRMPIEMIRASLTNQKLDRSFTSNWKFYGQ